MKLKLFKQGKDMRKKKKFALSKKCKLKPKENFKRLTKILKRLLRADKQSRLRDSDKKN